MEVKSSSAIRDFTILPSSYDLVNEDDGTTTLKAIFSYAVGKDL